jgi:hypothetical protein
MAAGGAGVIGWGPKASPHASDLKKVSPQSFRLKSQIETRTDRLSPMSTATPISAMQELPTR